MGAESGGLGLSTAEAAVVFEALGAGDSALAGWLTLHNMVTYMLERYGDAGRRITSGLGWAGMCSRTSLFWFRALHTSALHAPTQVRAPHKQP